MAGEYHPNERFEVQISNMEMNMNFLDGTISTDKDRLLFKEHWLFVGYEKDVLIFGEVDLSTCETIASSVSRLVIWS